MNSAWLLTTIGAIVSALGTISLVVSYYRRTVKKTLAENMKIRAHGSDTAWIFSAHRPSIIEGSVEGEPAPYRIYVFPCSTYDPNIGLPEPFRIMNHYVELQVDKKEPTAFECEVPQGDYCIYFEVPQNVAFNTNLNLVAKHYEYPLKSLHELGLTFLEVGIPLVITGVVLLSGGAASV